MNFTTYQIAVQFYHGVTRLKLPHHLRDQLIRAASSIALNLAEGAGKRQFPKEQRRFYIIAMGSFRESRAVLDLALTTDAVLLELADKLGAHLYKLIQKAG